MSCSIVVVTWRSAPDVRRLVASMNRWLDGQEELVVVDNASGDRVEEEARHWRGPLRFIAMEENAGYGAAANRGVESAGNAAIVLLNPDTELLDAGLTRLAAFALERRALTGPRVLYPDGSLQPSASGPPVGPWPWLGALLPGRLQPPLLRARTEPWRLERTTRVSWLTGACVAGARDVLLSLGPFDPAIHLYGEDMDLGLRAMQAGVPSWLCPGLCRVVHHGQASTAQRFPDGPWELMVRNRRAVLRRVYGGRRERIAHAALVTNLRLRATAKRALGRDAAKERALLDATIRSGLPPQLPEHPAQRI